MGDVKGGDGRVVTARGNLIRKLKNGRWTTTAQRSPEWLEEEGGRRRLFSQRVIEGMSVVAAAEAAGYAAPSRAAKYLMHVPAVRDIILAGLQDRGVSWELLVRKSQTTLWSAQDRAMPDYEQSEATKAAKVVLDVVTKRGLPIGQAVREEDDAQRRSRVIDIIGKPVQALEDGAPVVVPSLEPEGGE